MRALAQSIKNYFTVPHQALPVKDEKRAISTPTPLSNSRYLSLFNPITKSKIKVTPYTALSVSSVLCAARAISEGLASLSFELFEQEGQTIKPARNHDLYYLLSKEPHPERYTTFTFIRSLVFNAIIKGNGYARIHRDGNDTPVYFTLLDPSFVDPFENKTGDLFYIVTDPITLKEEALKPYEIIHINTASMDGVSGIDIIKRNAENLGISIASTDFAGAFFGNGAHTSGLFSHPGNLEDGTEKRLADQLNTRHSGVEKTGRSILLSGGMTYTPIGVDPSKAMLVDNRKFQVEEIARIIRVPLHMLYHMEKGASFASVEVMDTAFVKHTLRPWAKHVESEFDRKILTPSEKRSGKYYTRFNLKSMLRGDAKARAELYATLWDRGVFSSNDIRKKENENPREGGDTYYVPMNFEDSKTKKPNE